VLLPILLRWVLSLLVVRRMGRAPGLIVPGPFALWLRDCFTFAVWAGACFVRHVDWRGQKISLAGAKS
jgi:hypothetical protein